MKRFLFSLLAFLAIGSGIQAQTMLQDVIYVDDVVFEPGENEATIEIKYNVDNAPTTGIKGLQFELDLPDGFTLKENSRQRIIVSDIQEDFTVTAKKQTDVHKIRFMMVSTVDNHLDFEDGLLFSLTVVADASVTGGTYPATVGGYGQISYIQMSGSTSQGDATYFQDPLTFYLKMPIELSEEVSYAEGFGNYTDVTVVMNKRTLKADTWNTICLPFDMDATTMQKAFGEGNEITLATLTGSDYVEKDGKIKDIIIKFNTSSTTAITANTPYLIKLKNAVETFEVEGVSLSDNIVPSSVSGGDCTFYGNYDVITDLGKDEPALFISGNKFYYATGNSKLKSFRGYFTHTKLAQYIQDLSAGANISLFVDDEPTGIRNIVTTQDNDDVYDISGRKVNADKTTLQKGIYITNGKKETVH
ncbi:MAG: hypothetical protein IKX33_10320 [Prevotella sp.]|nr:hypothetical protein [Prevotella sp.]